MLSQARYLTDEELEQNMNTFLALMDKINIPGARMDELKARLLESDFFIAPASTKYHSNVRGGLCQHSLNVYYTLANLCEQYKDKLEKPVDENSILILGLFHDISKIDYYETYYSNVKIYSENGSKHDNAGNFDWVSVEDWKVKEADDRLLIGTHEENSLQILASYIPLSREEAAAILNHHMHTNDGNNSLDQTAICDKYPLAVLLHIADFLSTFMLEGPVKRK